jgi:hypothetical protein
MKSSTNPAINKPKTLNGLNGSVANCWRWSRRTSTYLSKIFCYIAVSPTSAYRIQRRQERDRISELTDRSQGCTPIPRRLNRELKGWANYFSLGHPSQAYRNINWHLGYRLAHHLNQRPDGMSLYAHLPRLGLKFL